MNILIPTDITAAMFTSSSVAEPAATETTWVSAGTYAVGDKRIRTGTHREYKCLVAHTGITTAPEDDTTNWEDYGPTVKWAAFDRYVSTASTLASPLSMVVAPGFADAISMYGLTGTQVVITHKATAGGSTLETRTISLYAESLGLYEYLFGPKNPKSKIVETGFAMRPAPEFTVTVTGSSTVAVGMLNFGLYRNILGDWGGVNYGASVEPITYSRIQTDQTTGKVSIKRGNAATGMRVTVTLPSEAANYALSSIQEVLDVPVSFVASSELNYEGLNVFGLGSATLTYTTYGMAQLAINVKGMI